MCFLSASIFLFPFDSNRPLLTWHKRNIVVAIESGENLLPVSTEKIQAQERSGNMALIP